MSAAAALICTERLILRAVRQSDLPAVAAIHADPATSRHRPGGPTSPADSAGQLDRWLAHWAEHGFGYWAITLADTGEVVGFGGLQRSEHDRDRYLNLYYRFTPSAWGRGYATEMSRAAVDWAREAQPDRAVLIVTAVTNSPAIRVAAKLGFTEFRRAPYQGAPSVFFHS